MTGQPLLKEKNTLFGKKCRTNDESYFFFFFSFPLLTFLHLIITQMEVLSIFLRLDFKPTRGPGNEMEAKLET